MTKKTTHGKHTMSDKSAMAMMAEARRAGNATVREHLNRPKQVNKAVIDGGVMVSPGNPRRVTKLDPA